MNLSPLAVQRFYDNDNRPLVGGKLFTYVAGTDTKIVTYEDYTGVAENTNPVNLDFRGECQVWLDPALAYKFVLSPRTDTDPPTNPIWTVDHITVSPPSADNAASATGTENNISVSIPSISGITTFLRIVFTPLATNTGPVLFTVNAFPSKQIRTQNRYPLSGGELQGGGIYEVIYNGVYWLLQSPSIQPPQQRTPVEEAALVTPVNFWQPPGHPYRYGTNTNPGTTDMTAAINTAADICRAGALAMQLPGQIMLVTASLNFSGIRVYGQSGDGGFDIKASSSQFDVITTAGDTTLENFRVDGGWDGVTAGQSGNAIAIQKLTGDQFAYLVTIRNVVVTNAKRCSIYIRRGGYSFLSKVRCQSAGLHGLEIDGTGPTNISTSIMVDGKSQFSNTPNGRGIKLSASASSVNFNGVIMEDTSGVELVGNDFRSISFTDVYQENFTNPSTNFMEFGTSAGVGLTVDNCFGGLKTMTDPVNWQNFATMRGNSLLDECAPPLAGLFEFDGNREDITTTTGSFTSASIALPRGRWLIFATLQTVAAAGTPALSDVGIVITTNSAASGLTQATGAGAIVQGAARMQGTASMPTSIARLNTTPFVFRNTAAATIYLRAGLTFTTGGGNAVAYNGYLVVMKA